MPPGTLSYHLPTAAKLYGSVGSVSPSSVSIRCELNPCTLAAPATPSPQLYQDLPQKIYNAVIYPFHGAQCPHVLAHGPFSPPLGLALTATGSLPPPHFHLSFRSLVMTLPVFLGVTPLLIVPMTYLVTEPGKDLFLGKCSLCCASVPSLGDFLRLFSRVPLP